MPPERRLAAALVPLAVAAGVLVRAAGLWTDFWLDEVWSLNIARRFGAAEILLRVPFDNNHILNTLWLRWVGEPAWWGWYRLPSLAAGVVLVLLLRRAAARWGRAEGAFAAAAASASYPLVLYSSEARGYMMMLAFAAGAFLSLDAWQRERSRRAYAGWAACVALGSLSQLIFAQAYAALAAWSVLKAARRRPPRWKDLAALHVPAAAAAAFIYIAQVRGMEFGGGPEFSALGLLRETLAVAHGCADGSWAWAAGAVGLGAAAWAIRDLARAGSDEWLFFAIAVFGAPAAIFAITASGAPDAVLGLRPPILYPRYFLVAMAFAIPLWARAAAAAYRSGGVPAALAAAALALFVAGNGSRLLAFARDGRGRYLEALRYIAARSEGRETTVGSGHDFAIGMMLDFYAPRVPEGAFRYVPRERWTRDEPRWVIRHELRHDPAPRAEQIARNGNRYRLERAFRYSDQSGCDWILYRLADPGRGPT